MRTVGDDAHGERLRALIVLPAPADRPDQTPSVGEERDRAASVAQSRFTPSAGT